MRVRHERPSADLEFNVRAPLRFVLASGKELQVDAWSLKGARLADPIDVTPAKASLVIPFQGVDVQFPVNLKPGEAPGEVLFDGLTGRQRETLATFYRSVMNGRMVPVDGIITSLDAPVDLVPMGETEEEEAKGTAKTTPRSLRVFVNAALYLVGFVVIFGFVASRLVSMFDTVQVGQAHVAETQYPLRAANVSYVDEIRVQPGDFVTAGQTLVVLSNPGHGEDLSDLRRDIRRAQKRVKDATQRVKRHQANRPDMLDSLANKVAAQIKQRRLGDFLGHYDMDAVLRAQAQLELFEQGLSQRPDDYHDTVITLQRRLEDEQIELAKLKRDLGGLKSAAAAMDIKAPTDGVIVDVSVFQDQFLARGALTVTLNALDTQRISGWVPEKHAAHVFVGMGAKVAVFVDGQTVDVTARVVDLQAGPNPFARDAYGVQVIVEPDLAGAGLDRLPHQQPVSLTLSRGRIAGWGL